MCFDEWGAVELRPVGGVAWARQKMPLRRRATYRRLKGTEQFLGFYDVHRDCLSRIFRKHERLPDLFDASRRRRVYRHLRYRHSRLGNSPPLNRIRSVRPVQLEQH